MEMAAAIATKKGIGLAILDLILVGPILAFYPKRYRLLIFYGILGYVGFLVPFFHRLDRNDDPLFDSIQHRSSAPPGELSFG